MNHEQLIDRTMEVVQQVKPKEEFKVLARLAKVVILNLQNDWQRQESEHERELQMCEQALEAIKREEYGPLVEFAAWQAGELGVEVAIERSEKLAENGGVWQLGRWKRSRTEIAHDFWELMAEGGD